MSQLVTVTSNAPIKLDVVSEFRNSFRLCTNIAANFGGQTLNLEISPNGFDWYTSGVSFDSPGAAVISLYPGYQIRFTAASFVGVNVPFLIF